MRPPLTETTTSRAFAATKRPAVVLPLILVLAVFLQWLPALSASFQFDDWNVIVNEPRVHSLAAWWASMPGIRPLLKLSYALNFTMDAGPFGFRLVNVCAHAFSAVFVFWLLRERGIRAWMPVAAATLAAFVAAGVFALHPVQTEAVTYISGRSSSLAGFFCLVGVGCWEKGQKPSIAGRLRAGARKEQSAWLMGSAVAYVAAVACKETAMVLPLALWLYCADRPLRATLIRLAPLLLLTLAMLAIVWSLPTYRHLLTVSLDTRSITANLMLQSQAVFYLAGQLIRPWNGNADPQLALNSTVSTLTILLCGAWAAAAIVALLRVRKNPIGAFAVLWFLLWLAPTNSLLPRLDVANDRQLYLALIGPAWWLAVRLTSLLHLEIPAHLVKLLLALKPHAQRSLTAAPIDWLTSASKWAGALGMIATLLLLSAATFQRNRIYDTEVSFWQDTAARNPSSARAANNLGMAYAMACRAGDAAGEFERSITLDASDYRARINLALLRRQALPGVDDERCASRPP